MKTSIEIQALRDASTDNKSDSTVAVSDIYVVPTVTDKMHLQMKHLFESFPDDIRVNTKDLRCGIKYLPEEDRTVPYMELTGK